jgi:UDP-N-acetylmuramyl-tripeptide synthetase
VGVTGTNGKTTTSYYARSVLEAAGYGAGLVGTIRHHSGTRVVEADNTTPGPLEIHALLREMESAGLAFAVMEVSSHGLDQGRVADVPFVAGLFTNLASDHLDYHRTRAEYLKAKAKLFECLEPQAIAVLNHDDWASSALLDRCRARTVLYGRGPGADLRWRVEDSGLWGSELALSWQGRDLGRARLAMPGMHNASNAAAAAAFGLAAQFPEDRVLQGLAAVKGVPGRLEQVPLDAPFKVFVDFAHTEGALKALLEGLRAVHPGRILLVFGCGGDRDRTKRPRMGRVGGTLADRCWITSDNPRTEDPDSIIREVESGIPCHAWYAVEPHRERAIREALVAAEPGDAVVIAGKGHENTQKIGREVRRFDDREVVRTLWREISGDGETAELAAVAEASGE